MRIRRWADMSGDSQDALLSRGLDAIFDPSLRSSIVALIEDVRERGDAAVCDALARFDGIEVSPTGLRVTDDEIDAARVDDDVDAAIDDAISHLRAFNEQQLARMGDWSFESEAGLTVGEKITPIASAGLFTPSGKASYPSVTYQLLVPAIVAGVPQIVAVVPPLGPLRSPLTSRPAWNTPGGVFARPLTGLVIGSSSGSPLMSVSTVMSSLYSYGVPSGFCMPLDMCATSTGTSAWKITSTCSGR